MYIYLTFNLISFTTYSICRYRLDEDYMRAHKPWTTPTTWGPVWHWKSLKTRNTWTKDAPWRGVWAFYQCIRQCITHAVPTISTTNMKSLIFFLQITMIPVIHIRFSMKLRAIWRHSMQTTIVILYPFNRLALDGIWSMFIHGYTLQDYFNIYCFFYLVITLFNGNRLNFYFALLPHTLHLTPHAFTFLWNYVEDRPHWDKGPSN